MTMYHLKSVKAERMLQLSSVISFIRSLNEGESSLERD